MGYARQIGPCGDYELFADANVTNWLIAYGFMAGPVVPPSAEPAGGQVFSDDGGQVFQDDDGQVFHDD